MDESRYYVLMLAHVDCFEVRSKTIHRKDWLDLLDDFGDVLVVNV